MKLITTSVIALALAATPAFAGNKTKHKAQSENAAQNQKADLDLAASNLSWEGTKVTGKHAGKVKVSKGYLETKNNQVIGGQFEVDMNSITNEDLTDKTYNDKLIGHLKSEDFFNVAKFPSATFKIKSVAPKVTDKGTHEVIGDLTIKGASHPISFPATIVIGDGKIEAKGTAVVDRTLWNIRYGSGKFFKGLGDKVINDTFTVVIDIVARK